MKKVVCQELLCLHIFTHTRVIIFRPSKTVITTSKALCLNGRISRRFVSTNTSPGVVSSYSFTTNAYNYPNCPFLVSFVQ